MFVRVLSCLLLICLQFNIQAQQSNLWLTYSEGQFMHTPGIEGSYYFNQHIGIQLGTSIYFRDLDQNKISNISKFDDANFYSLNLNACTYLIHSDQHSLGVSSGIKVNYGPNYQLLYKNDEYQIYFDAAEYRAEYSLDIGLTYRYKKLASLIKFDVARKNFTFGLGYSFGSLNKPVDLP